MRGLSAGVGVFVRASQHACVKQTNGHGRGGDGREDWDSERGEKLEWILTAS